MYFCGSSVCAAAICGFLGRNRYSARYCGDVWHNNVNKLQPSVFSRSLTEYWHRWHMTLGDWCRNYIFYPLSISKRFLNFGKWLKPRFGAHISKVLPGCIASVITFIVIGVWHGANMKYLYFGLWNGIVIMLAELFAPVSKKVAGGFFKLTGLREKGIFATIVSVIWTFMLILVGYYFDIAANASTAFHMLFKSVTDFHISELGINNIILNLGACGLDEYDILLLIICTLLWFFISFVEENKKLDMRDFILSRKAAASLGDNISWHLYSHNIRLLRTGSESG